MQYTDMYAQQHNAGGYGMASEMQAYIQTQGMQAPGPRMLLAVAALQAEAGFRWELVLWEGTLRYMPCCLDVSLCRFMIFMPESGRSRIADRSLLEVGFDSVLF